MNIIPLQAAYSIQEILLDIEHIQIVGYSPPKNQSDKMIEITTTLTLS